MAFRKGLEETTLLYRVQNAVVRIIRMLLPLSHMATLAQSSALGCKGLPGQRLADLTRQLENFNFIAFCNIIDFSKSLLLKSLVHSIPPFERQSVAQYHNHTNIHL
jgi:hypothetical protein